MHVILALALALVLATDSAAAPPNDACVDATPIPSVPFTTTVDTSAATSDVTDPQPSCDGGTTTVWFTYTASSAITLLFDTAGSDGEPQLVAFTGGCGSLAEVACYYDDDFDGTTQLVVPVASGQTIHLMAGSQFTTNLVLNVTRAPFNGAEPLTRAIVRSGDPTPVGAGFGSFTRPLMLSSKDVAFIGTTDGIFVDQGSGPVTIGLSGDPTPVGGTFATFGIQAVAPGGVVFFQATINGGSASSGIFKRTGSGITPVVLAGAAAPGGGTFTAFAGGIAASPSGLHLAFVGSTTPFPRGLYVVAGGIVTGPVLATGSPHPCGGSVSLTSSATPIMAINDFGDIGLFANAATDGILQYSAGSWSAVACDNGPSPLGGGGTISSLGRQVRIMNVAGGPVAWSGRTSLPGPGPNPDAMFVASFVAAREGDLTSTGDTITTINTNVVPEIDSTGRVALVARTNLGRDTILRGMLLSPLTPVLAEGDPCPAPFGGTVAVLDTRWIDLADDGTVVAEVTCAAGRGIIRIPVSGSPTLVATHADTTPAGAGFLLNDPSHEAGTTGYGGGRTGIFKTRCTSVGCDPITSVLQPLTPLPGVPGEFVLSLDLNNLVGQGKLIAAFAATAGTNRRQVLLASRDGALELVAAEGDTVPGGTAEYVSLQANDFLSDTPTDAGADRNGIAFLASIFDPVDSSSEIALFLARNGAVTELARGGQPAPNGDLFDSFGSPFVKGRRVFFRIETASLLPCLAVATPGGTLGLGCEGDPLPTPPGGTLGEITGDVMALGSKGPVFRGIVDVGSPPECLFTATSSTLTPIVCAGSLLPGGGSIGAFNDGTLQRLAAYKRRTVSSVSDVNFSISGLYAFGRGRIARLATPTSATPIGGQYRIGEYNPSIYGKTVAFSSLVSGGTSSSALFLSTLAR